MQRLSAEFASLRTTVLPLLNEPRKEDDIPRGDPTDGPSKAADLTNVLCWQRKGGCFCRCHAKTRLTSNRNRYLFIESSGWSSAFQTCNLATCDSRRYGLKIRIATSRFWLPLAITATFELRSGWLPTYSLTAQRIVRYTSLGFVKLRELDYLCPFSFRSQGSYDDVVCRQLYESAVRDKVADIKRLFATGEASFADVDPAGKGWLDKLVSAPLCPFSVKSSENCWN